MGSSAKGFIIADRDLFTHPIWLAEPFTKGQAWLDLIGLANHSETELIVRGKTITAKRGEINRSYRWLARRWQWSPNKVIRFVEFLEAERMIETKTEQGETVLKLCNYCYFQDRYRKNGTQNGTPDGTLTEHEQKKKTININNNLIASQKNDDIDVDDFARGYVPEHLQKKLEAFIKRGEDHVD